ncbi:uncharacterized protein KY384_005179 [Bacidia gigantensis]|uniref:uncharacterized protein n=1 Tax=Bacidia gigantensis TaxID=2732470 RepID=UPI001D056EB4|nr:uncharacterized protein KY384_005179 [Bacidia gigantensis]KAG8529698.1 hypothetical protein KY384_005179 [Bacidia gigantensis]
MLNAAKNHDLDFGVPQFEYLSKQCNFPWLLANVLDPALGEDVSLANCAKYKIIESSNKIKIGVIGLGEREWLETINSLPPNLIYLSASETAKKLVPEMRAAGAEIIVALTHQRDPNDIKLAERVPLGLIDLILGGHDHHYTHEYVNGTHILCSGSDFKQLSYIEARRKVGSKSGWDFDIIRHDIKRSIAESPEAAKLVNELNTNLKNKLEQPVGHTAVPLDSRFSTIRARESNIGNFVCDLMRFYYNAECAIMASGTIRGDQVYPPGVILIKDILNCFPFEDTVVVIRVTGQAILDALENAVCKVPALEGRFPQVSNMHFRYNPNLPPGKRVVWAKLNHEPLELTRKYTVSTRGYMIRGKDGYTSFLARSEGGEAEEIINEEEGVLISTIIRQYFMSLRVMGQWTRWSESMSSHWSKVHEGLHADNKIRKPGTSRANSVQEDAETMHQFMDRSPSPTPAANRQHTGAALPFGISGGGFKREREMGLLRKYVHRWLTIAKVGRPAQGLVDEHVEPWLLPFWTNAIAPKVEGRIVLDDGKG